MKRTLKNKLKKALKAAYFCNREKIPFMQKPTNCGLEDSLKMCGYFLVTLISGIAFIAVSALMYLDMKENGRTFTDRANSKFVLSAFVFGIVAFAFGPLSILRLGISRYFGSAGKVFREMFLIDKKRQFKQTVNQLLKTFEEIAFDLEEHNKIVSAVNEQRDNLRNLQLGRIFLHHLHRMAGVISVEQHVYSQESMPESGLNNSIKSMLDIAYLGVLCNLIGADSAQRGSLFAKRIIYHNDWRDYLIEPPVNWKEIPDESIELPAGT